MKQAGVPLHYLLALWAADCAEHVLPAFERHHPWDDRPRKAVEGVRLWARGRLKMSTARKLALAAHTAAREVTDPRAIAAARAAGHAAATAHVASHARHAASYALKAAGDAMAEWEWQRQHMPTELKSLMERDSFTPPRL